jgi:DNA-binding CsgD family transcriptional regulator
LAATCRPDIPRDSGSPNPPSRARVVVSHIEAIASGDPREALMAEGLAWLMRFAPSSLGVFYVVDRRLRKFGDGVIVVRKHTASALDHERTFTRYDERYHLLDPFAPRRFATSPLSVIDLSDIGTIHATDVSLYVTEFLAGIGMCGQTTLLIRAQGQIVAGVDLLRATQDPPPSARQLAFLRSSHAFLERAYTCATGLPAARPSACATPTVRLTRRELDVARLVANGARNSEVARALAITEATVKTHLVRVYEKLNIRTRTQLAVLLNSDPGPFQIGPMPTKARAGEGAA